MLKSWLQTHWVACALVTGLMLLALVPIGIGDRGWPITLIYLALPVYMLHQVEEHWGDRFRNFVNTKLFDGVEVLTTGDVLWINLPGVWGVTLLSLYAAHFGSVGNGLAAPYLMLVNAIAHGAMVKRTGRYHPGLISAVALFLPLGLASLVVVPATLGQHALGLVVALLIHAAIVGVVLIRYRVR